MDASGVFGLELLVCALVPLFGVRGSGMNLGRLVGAGAVGSSVEGDSPVTSRLHSEESRCSLIFLWGICFLQTGHSTMALMFNCTNNVEMVLKEWGIEVGKSRFPLMADHQKRVKA